MAFASGLEEILIFHQRAQLPPATDIVWSEMIVWLVNNIPRSPVRELNLREKHLSEGKPACSLMLLCMYNSDVC